MVRNCATTSFELPRSHARLLLIMKLNTECYQDTRAKIAPYISSTDRLNIIADESTNIRRQRVQNICIHTRELGAVYIDSEAIQGDTLSGEWNADWLHERIHKITGGDLSRVNAISTDTCATQRKALRLLSQREDYRHVFSLGCDSHGLQLLIGDVVKIGWFGLVFKQANSIVSAFSTSPKQLASLRMCMEEAYGKQHFFTIACITRWGTHLAMLRSVYKTQLAFQRFMDNLKPEDATDTLTKIKPLAWDQNFWINVQFVIELLDPIDKAIKMSESDRSTAGHVVNRWKRVRRMMKAKLSEKAHQHPDIASCEEKIFEKRFKRQVTDVYYVAHLLNPKMVNDSEIPFLTETQWRDVLHKFFQLHGLNLITAMREFDEFRDQTARFAPSALIWKFADDPAVFWRQATAFAPNIGMCPYLAALACDVL
jgi:Protein of unknown function (DUF 659)